MNLESVTRIVAALNQNGGPLTVKAANQAGISKTALQRGVAAGVITRTARGKYVAPGTASRELAFKGAYIAQDGVLSFKGAWSYWGLDGIDDFVLEWSIPHHGRASLPHVYRRRVYEQLEIVERDGIVVTSVRQTLLDIAARFDIDLVERAYESALRKGYIDDIEMRAWVAEHGGWQGAPVLRAVQARRRPGERPTGSDDETILLQHLRRAGIVAVRQWEVVGADGRLIGFGDFGHPPKACITEIDGLASHDLAQRQSDYDRQGRIEDEGYLVRRLTHEDVRYRPKYAVDRVRRGIALARPL
jgi:very-short-patch-repair endonuclease